MNETRAGWREQSGMNETRTGWREQSGMNETRAGWREQSGMNETRAGWREQSGMNETRAGWCEQSGMNDHRRRELETGKKIPRDTDHKEQQRRRPTLRQSTVVRVSSVSFFVPQSDRFVDTV